MSDLVGNPEARFSRVAAHIVYTCYIDQFVFCLVFIVLLFIYFIFLFYVLYPEWHLAPTYIVYITSLTILDVDSANSLTLGLARLYTNLAHYVKKLLYAMKTKILHMRNLLLLTQKH